MDPKTYLVLLHLIGLVVGLGSVTTLDFYLLKFLRGDLVSRSDAHLVELVSRLAMAGLVCLWISGLGFLTLAWMNTPELLTSPKLHAKLIIVGILTINGALLHFKVLPQVERAVGRPLFCRSGARSDRIWMRVCGAVSAASWWTPFVLGTVRELNFAASIWVFLGAYTLALALFGAGFTIVESWLSHRGGRVPAHDLPGAYPDTAVPEFPAHPLYAGSDRRPIPKNEETHRVLQEEKTFESDGDGAARSARDRVRDYYGRPDRSGEPGTRADGPAGGRAPDGPGAPRH
jgi:hypothetical protein